MRFVTLLTDFGVEDNFVSVMKAVILRINPTISIIDITHNIQPQNIFQAGFLLKHSFKYFPKGTIHLVVVDPGVGTERKAVIVKTKNYFFIAPDNGVLSFVLREESPSKIIHINNHKYFLKPVSNTFHGRDIFAPVVGHLSKGLKPEVFGEPITKIKTFNFPQPEIQKKKLAGQIIYIDHFGNLISNISRKMFFDFVEDNDFMVRIKDKTINKISNSYQEQDVGKILAIFGSFDYLEISVREDSAKEFVKAELGTPVEIILL